MACTCQTVRSHTAVILLLVCSLAEGSESYDYVTRTDVGIVDNILTLHAAGNCRVNDDGTHQVTDICCLATSGIYAYAHLAEVFQQFVRSVDDGRDDFSRNKHLVSADCARYENVVNSSYAEQIVSIHHDGILCHTLPNTKVAGFFPVHICK